MTAPDNRPVSEVRLGAVKAAIWENDTESGDVYHSVTFERLYRNRRRRLAQYLQLPGW